MSPSRVLYICPNAKRGGAEQGMTLFLKYHDPARWRGQVFFLNDGPMVRELRDAGIVCHVLSRPARLRKPSTILRAALEIRKVAREQKIDVIHGVMSYGHVFGGTAALLAGIPELWFQHGPPQRIDWLSSRVPTRTILVNSGYMEKQQAKYWANTERVRILYPGIENLDLEKFESEAKTQRSKLDLPDSTTLIGLPGRLSPMKGHSVLLQAAKLLKDSSADFHLLFIGGTFMSQDEDYLKGLKSDIHAHGLDRHVSFTGHLSPPYSAMLACDVLVNASVVPEPFAATVIESMMLGRAVVAPASGGSLEAIQEGTTGLLFEMNNPVRLFKVLSRLTESPKDRERLGRAARSIALEKFTIERMTRDLESEYERLLDKGAGNSKPFWLKLKP